MRKIFIALIAFIMILSVLSSCEKGEQVAFMSDYDNSSRTTIAELCASQKKITVGFIGGSITEADKYRVYVMDYLRKNYPDNIFEELVCAIGGTGSSLGVCLIDKNLIEKDIDMLFIEYSVNDGSDSSVARNSVEGMIRKALYHNKGTIISVLGTATADSMKAYDEGGLPGAVFAHKEVAEYYNIPYINVGKVLYDYIKTSGEPLTDYLPDNVHPNYEGGKIYADEINKYLESYEWNINFKSEPLREDNYENMTMLYASDYINEQWVGSPEGKLFANTTPNYIYSREVGSTLELDFYGSTLGFMYRLAADAGNFEYRIDGGDWHLVGCWDEYCLDYDRPSGGIHIDGLEKTNHHLEIRIADSKHELSTGNTIRIAAIFCEREN